MNARRQCCILSKFYIKPQLPVGASSAVSSCILSKFYIKPQQRVRHKIGHSCCILSKFYIKPQLLLYHRYNESVVSYRNSTSNHNTGNKVASPWLLYLIEILHQTTTMSCTTTSGRLLYLIEILHQTTTSCATTITASKLYLIEILHQTTTLSQFRVWYCGCILSKFYIKPQQGESRTRRHTSCILSKFYIKPQHPRKTNYSS